MFPCRGGNLCRWKEQVRASILGQRTFDSRDIFEISSRVTAGSFGTGRLFIIYLSVEIPNVVTKVCFSVEFSPVI